MFGRISAVLDKTTNAGHSYSNASEIVATIATSNGGSATKFLTFTQLIGKALRFVAP